MALIVLGWLAVGQAPRLAALTEAPRRWLPLALRRPPRSSSWRALPLGAAVETYQATKLFQRPDALALERLAGPGGAVVAYAGLNKPYTFFGSRLQNDVRIVPRQGDLEDQYYEWGGTTDFPYAGDDYVRWRRRVDALGVDFVVVHRSPWEDPEREWMIERPGAFRLERVDPVTEICESSPQRINGGGDTTGAPQQAPERQSQEQQAGHRRLDQKAVPARLHDEPRRQADRVGEPGDAQRHGQGRSSGRATRRRRPRQPAISTSGATHQK